ncbi:assimilatory nitrite reductase (NAD(P)H) small subunit [Rhizobium sp. PP-WC-2G-219]|nr:assimilatory nitrite reductase (NAD(P)H) small subunit [Rhizobium sp. PP-F2F-G20b]TCL96169.1 assimilatory nitrite reductase (NAD(P)H) small subunit [Rhizobium sp. PP-WC-2G-219]
METNWPDKNWVEIGDIHDIPVRGARCVKTPHGRIAVFRTAEDHVYAMEDRCPHKGGPLSQGIVHGTSVTCPLHNMVISLETGRALGADEGEVRTVAVRNRDGMLSIALDSLMLMVAAE